MCVCVRARVCVCVASLVIEPDDWGRVDVEDMADRLPVFAVDNDERQVFVLRRLGQKAGHGSCTAFAGLLDEDGHHLCRQDRQELVCTSCHARTPTTCMPWADSDHWFAGKAESAAAVTWGCLWWKMPNVPSLRVTGVPLSSQSGTKLSATSCAAASRGSSEPRRKYLICVSPGFTA